MRLAHTLFWAFVMLGIPVWLASAWGWYRLLNAQTEGGSRGAMRMAAFLMVGACIVTAGAAAMAAMIW